MKKILGWVGGIVTVVLATVLGAYLTPPQGVSGWNKLTNLLNSIWHFLSTPTQINSALLILLIICTSAFSLILFLNIFFGSKEDYTTYNDDVFYDIHWTWRWSGSAVLPSTLKPYCPKCSTNLLPPNNYPYNKFYSTGFHCIQCDDIKILDYEENELHNRICIQIKAIVNNGEWKMRNKEMKKKYKNFRLL
jgi:hypothetical protein